MHVGFLRSLCSRRKPTYESAILFLPKGLVAGLLSVSLNLRDTTGIICRPPVWLPVQARGIVAGNH